MNFASQMMNFALKIVDLSVLRVIHRVFGLILGVCTHIGFCHGDLHKGNVLCDPVNGRLTAVIDWESVSWGPREADANELRGEEEDGSDDMADLAIPPTAG